MLNSFIFRIALIPVSAIFLLPLNLFSSEDAGSKIPPKKSERFTSFLMTPEEHINILLGKVSALETRVIALNDAPEDSNKNPIRASSTSISSGKALYMQYCKNCHGDNGAGDGPFAKAISSIQDLSIPEIQNRSDQQLFDQITNAKPPMPSFKNLSEKNRWDLINYIRTFAGEK